MCGPRTGLSIHPWQRVPEGEGDRGGHTVQRHTGAAGAEGRRREWGPPRWGRRCIWVSHSVKLELTANRFLNVVMLVRCVDTYLGMHQHIDNFQRLPGCMSLSWFLRHTGAYLTLPGMFTCSRKLTSRRAPETVKM